MFIQNTNHVLLVKPSHFCFNNQTAVSNVFQHKPMVQDSVLMQQVNNEFNYFASMLTLKGINVVICNDTDLPVKPDAIFPNNWISFHSSGEVVLYPMFAENRRAERRKEVIDTIAGSFFMNAVIDLSFYEQQGIFLEGTGSIVFDHVNKISFAGISPRTNKGLFEKLSQQLGYTPISFTAKDSNAMEVYHTNVVMSVGENFVIICAEAITDGDERNVVCDLLQKVGKTIIEISIEQMNQFAGNVLELVSNKGEKIIVMSQTAYKTYTPQQIGTLKKFGTLLPIPIPTIETIGGGSVRCMIAEIFLPK